MEKVFGSSSSLSVEEIADLQNKFNVKVGPSVDESRTLLKGDDLLDTNQRDAYLDEVTRQLGSPSRFVTGSQFAKRFALFATVPKLYAMTMFNKGMHLTLQDCQLDGDSADAWFSHARLIPVEVSQPASEGERKAWRDELIKSMFSDQLGPLWRSLSASTRIPMELLWENTAVRVYSLYERRIGEAQTEQQKLRIEEDYRYLVEEAPAALFGESKNPLAKFYRPITDEQPTRIRKTCCFYFEVSEDGSYCSTCPNKKRG